MQIKQIRHDDRRLKLTARFAIGDRVNLKATGPNAIPHPMPAVSGLTVEKVTLHDNSCPHVRLLAVDGSRIADACQDAFELA
jgi:hypothetical protein